MESWHSQNSLFKHFQGYLGIFRDIGKRERGKASLVFFENLKSVLIFERKTLTVAISGLNFPFKM